MGFFAYWRKFFGTFLKRSAVSPSDDRDLLARVLQKSGTQPRIVVVIPAYNEASSIAASIASVRQQTLQPTAIIVAANNCTDGTENAARQAGASVFLAEPNRQKKAGALNLTLSFVMDYLDNHDAVLVMDADTTLSPTFIQTALARLVEGVGGVGGAFIGRPSTNVVGILQQMEYFRYRSEIKRHGERAFVLSGTGTLFSVAALRAVRTARKNGALPAGDSYYDTASLTEDNEITLALLALGYECLSPEEMTTTTDVMESIKALWDQRVRWYLGALWNLRAFGFRMPWQMKLIYWKQQAGLLLFAFGFLLYVSLLTLTFLSGNFVVFSPFWGVLTILLIAERVFSVWKMGWRPRLLALFAIDQAYSILLLIIFLGAFYQFLSGKKGQWVAT